MPHVILSALVINTAFARRERGNNGTQTRNGDVAIAMTIAALVNLVSMATAAAARFILAATPASPTSIVSILTLEPLLRHAAATVF